MAIYMRIPGLAGSVTATGYQNWDELDAFALGAGRLITTTPGNVHNRVRSSTQATEMLLIKSLNQTSPLLFTKACGGRAIDEIKIDVCQTADALNPYAQYTLHNVIISSYGVMAEKDQIPLEWLGLNFTELEIRYSPYDEKHQLNSHQSVKAKMGSKRSLAVNLCRSVQDPSPEGFNLFVATVYGEVGGVRNPPEATWKAVGSVIINRVQQGIWRHRLNTASVIEHTGFDAYMDPCNINWDRLNLQDPHVRNHQQFLKAWAYLNDQQINHHIAMDKTENKKLFFLKHTLHDVYYRKAATTTANYYYSPASMYGRLPEFLKYLNNYDQYKVIVPGTHESEIKFYAIPADVEKSIRKK